MQPSVIVNQSFHSSYLTNLEWKIITSGATNSNKYIGCPILAADIYGVTLF